MSFTLENALQIATQAHEGRLSRTGGAYIDTLRQLVDSLKSQGADEATCQCAALHNVLEVPGFDAEALKECPIAVQEALELLHHDKDQEFIDQRSCDLIAEAVPAENATYQAREEEYLRYIENLKTNTLARAVKIADLELYLSDERLLKAEGREVKNRFRQEKYRKALEVLRA